MCLNHMPAVHSCNAHMSHLICAQCDLAIPEASTDRTNISPGAMSRTRWKPTGPNAQSSDAMQYSMRASLMRCPSTSGLRGTSLSVWEASDQDSKAAWHGPEGRRLATGDTSVALVCKSGASEMLSQLDIKSSPLRVLCKLRSITAGHVVRSASPGLHAHRMPNGSRKATRPTLLMRHRQE